MSLIRWTPNRELGRFFDRFNRMFDETMALGVPSEFSALKPGGLLPALRSAETTMTLADWTPAVDIQETPEAFLVNAELPEVKKEDVHVTIEDGVLLLTGERKQEREEKGKTYHRVERSYGRFERSFVLPDSVNEQKVNASYKDGVLHLMLPKSPTAKASTREIKIG